MGVNNYLKSKIAINLNQKRCKSCFSAFTISDVEVLSYLEFSVFGKLKCCFGQKMSNPLYNVAHFPVKTGDISDLYSIRHVSGPIKNREHVSVGIVEFLCPVCGNSIIVELNLDKLD